MSNWLDRLGRSSARHRWPVVIVWVIVALGLAVTNWMIGGVTVDNFEVPGVESQTALDLLEERFPERSGATAMVVFHSSDGPIDDPVTAPAIEATVEKIRDLDHVLGVTDPIAVPMSISPDGRTAFGALLLVGRTGWLWHPDRTRHGAGYGQPRHWRQPAG